MIDTFTLVLFVLVALLAGLGAGFGAGWHLRAEHDRPATRFEPMPPPDSRLTMEVVHRRGPDRHPEAEALVDAHKATEAELERAGLVLFAKAATQGYEWQTPAIEKAAKERAARRAERQNKVNRDTILYGPQEARAFNRN